MNSPLIILDEYTEPLLKDIITITCGHDKRIGLITSEGALYILSKMMIP